MLLNDEAGCPGKRRISGGSVGVCYSCARYGKRSETQIEPAAKLGADGVWQCDERRSAGVVLTAEQIDATDEMAGLAHVASRRHESAQGKPLSVGECYAPQRTDGDA